MLALSDGVDVADVLCRYGLQGALAALGQAVAGRGRELRVRSTCLCKNLKNMCRGISGKRSNAISKFNRQNCTFISVT